MLESSGELVLQYPAITCILHSQEITIFIFGIVVHAVRCFMALWTKILPLTLDQLLFLHAVYSVRLLLTGSIWGQVLAVI